MSKSSSALSRIDAFADRSSVQKYRHRGADGNIGGTRWLWTEQQRQLWLMIFV